MAILCKQCTVSNTIRSNENQISSFLMPFELNVKTFERFSGFFLNSLFCLPNDRDHNLSEIIAMEDPFYIVWGLDVKLNLLNKTEWEAKFRKKKSIYPCEHGEFTSQSASLCTKLCLHGFI
jgi:hypothetical protein